jgi:hypothetical protein
VPAGSVGTSLAGPFDGFDGFDKLTAGKLTAGKPTAGKPTAGKLMAAVLAAAMGSAGEFSGRGSGKFAGSKADITRLRA